VSKFDYLEFNRQAYGHHGREIVNFGLTHPETQSFAFRAQ